MEIREGFDETNGLKAQTDEKPDSGSKPETLCLRLPIFEYFDNV